jgi:hypothetical protein
MKRFELIGRYTLMASATAVPNDSLASVLVVTEIHLPLAAIMFAVRTAIGFSFKLEFLGVPVEPVVFAMVGKGNVGLTVISLLQKIRGEV